MSADEIDTTCRRATGSSGRNYAIFVTRNHLFERLGRAMPGSITQRKEWQFFAILPKADAALAAAWWAALILRGILPAIFAIVMGTLVAAV